jgi:hypothetical protein
MQDKGVMSFDYAGVAAEYVAIISSALREVAKMSVRALSRGIAIIDKLHCRVSSAVTHNVFLHGLNDCATESSSASFSPGYFHKLFEDV